MILHPPFIITPSLKLGLAIEGSYIQLEYAKRPGREGRTRYQWTISLNGKTKHKDFTGDDLQSGCLGGNLQEGFASLLSFLSAAGESFAYGSRTGREGENSDLFPYAVSAWASKHSDEISDLAIQIEESEYPLIEE